MEECAAIAAMALEDWDRLATGTEAFRDALYGSSCRMR